MELLAPVIYFAVKFGAYSGWMWLGLSRIVPPVPPRRSRAFAWAGARMALGVLLGSIILALFSLAPAGNRLGIPELFGSAAVTYVLVYAPLRAAEWGLLGRLMAGRERRIKGFIPWVAGGVCLSFVTDIAGFAVAATAIGGIC